ncbi:MAG: phBC6A51 family helix-turn-helix protein [Bacteroidota bacterium]
MKEKVNKQTGLSEQQETAVRLLIDGATFEDCAQTLGIDIATLYEWQAKPTFQAYSNRLLFDRKQHAGQHLFSLYNEALAAVRDCLQSENQMVRLKTAMYVLEKFEKTEIGLTDAREMISRKCTTTSSPLDYDFETVQFNEAMYQRLCEENHLV